MKHPNPAETLDITAEVCPMTFVRVKLKLAQMAGGAELAVRLREGEALANVPRSLRQEGHEILSLDREAGDVHRLIVRKKR
jgi:TusA-related sulfurtransferase